MLPPPTLPGQLSRSVLMRQGGFGVYDGLIEPDRLARLRAEAVDRFAFATDHLVTGSDDEEVRGGQPPRKYRSAEGGPVQDSIYSSRRIAEILQGLTGAGLEPTGSRGSFTYYHSAGDHLALHRDVETCDLAMITALHREGGDGCSGTLWIYPERIGEPLSSIRRTPRQGALMVDLAVGQSIVMLGGMVPHQLVPTSSGQARVVSLLCFRLFLPD